VPFVVGKAALGQVFSANSHSSDCSTVIIIIIIHHAGLVQCGRRTVLSVSPHPQEETPKTELSESRLNKYFSLF
jgi:hypothetical protein